MLATDEEGEVYRHSPMLLYLFASANKQEKYGEAEARGKE
jgi:hypothetical protein